MTIQIRIIRIPKIQILKKKQKTISERSKTYLKINKNTYVDLISTYKLSFFNLKNFKYFLKCSKITKKKFLKLN